MELITQTLTRMFEPVLAAMRAHGFGADLTPVQGLAIVLLCVAAVLWGVGVAVRRWHLGRHLAGARWLATGAAMICAGTAYAGNSSRLADLAPAESLLRLETFAIERILAPMLSYLI